MSSRTGASRADIDTSLFDDDKVKRLARLQRDSIRTAVSMTLYQAAILSSWRENRPLLAVDTAPAWFLDDPEPFIADLITVCLLDPDGRVKASSLDEWMKRYRAAIEGGHEGAARRWGSHRVPTGEGIGGVMPRQTDRQTLHPRARGRKAPHRGGTNDETDPSDRPATPMRSFGELMVEAGLNIEQIKGKTS